MRGQQNLGITPLKSGVKTSTQDALTKPVPNKRKNYSMYHSELVGIIRKMVADNTDDIAYLPNLALVACREIERLAEELKRERQMRGYYKVEQNPWK
jgi:hypothetical protein